MRTKPNVFVPGWLAQLPHDEARNLCDFYARRCLEDATTARCNGYGRRPTDTQDAGSWYSAARRWLALRSAIGAKE
jgi:hypothetical protein